MALLVLVGAVGTANGKNQLALIVPYHRVINSSDELGGYGGGLKRKQKLIDLEIKIAARNKEVSSSSCSNSIDRAPASLKRANQHDDTIEELKRQKTDHDDEDISQETFGNLNNQR